MAVRTLPRKPTRKRAPKRVSSRSLKRAPKRKRQRRQGPFRRWLRKWRWVWIPAAVLTLGGVGTAVYLYVTIPLPPERVLQQTTFLFDRNGEQLTSLSGEQDRTIIKLEKVPDHLKQAVLAAEDARFYSHPGISIVDIIRAGWTDITGGRITQGASTITQQLVRNVFPEVGTERTITRKVKEAILAIKLERQLDKNQILERYLNTIYLGDGAYGVQAAAQHYFNRPARELTLLQSATLAGIIPRPEGFNPRLNPENAKVRRDWVLGRLAELGHITPARAAALQEKPVKVKEIEEGYADHPGAWFIDYTRRFLLNRYGQDATFTGGLRVRTTMDQKWQRAANQAIRNHMSWEGAPDAALVAIDPNNGAIRAIASSDRFPAEAEKRAKTFDPATFGCRIRRGCDFENTESGGTGRQTGSAAKMFTLVAALDQGISLRSTFSGRSPVVIPDPTCFTNGEPWDPENYGGSSYGSSDLIGATRSSINTIYAQLMAEIGPKAFVKMSHRLGIRSKIPEVCSLTLGAMEVNVLEMTSAYATLASGGVRHNPTPIGAIRTRDNKLLWRNTGKGRQVIDENTAWQAVYALRQVLLGGTASAAYFGVDAFGKTGTEDDSSDGWFCGGTTELVTCVWVGHHEGQISVPGLTGGSYPARIWRDFMFAAHQDLEAGRFPTPEFTGETVKGSGVAPTTSPTPTRSPKPQPTTVKATQKPSPSPSPQPTSPPPTPSPSISPPGGGGGGGRPDD